ncbi:serine/threonine-protein kinase [Alkaliphilus transvaalensis]|uniref:serine/threonine-protein kinase n=1 Tax=Alkaliphilus transvaalensis TaxID=114628 RepID=UPI0006890DD5|nr:serine/threonine-protein kinase [Alkaliphilus transvaalensis]
MVYLLLSILVIGLVLLLFVEKNNKKNHDKTNMSQQLVSPNFAKNPKSEEDLMLEEDPLVTEFIQSNFPDRGSPKGTILNNQYVVEGILGEGGMGKVYLCRNLKLGNLWAVKYIPKIEGIRNSSIVAEEDILKKLNHTYLPQIVDIFKDENGTYLVESYIEGVSLDKKMKLEGPFNEEEVLNWLSHLTDVLMYLHGIKPHPIIYSDMKPSNVMITPDNKAVLIDFGVSMEFKEKSIISLREETVAITAKFAAPEQFEGYADTRTDLYSLGVMSFYLLTGTFPKVDEGFARQTKKVSKELLKVLEKCCQREMKNRYQGIEELKLDLDRIKESKKEEGNSFSLFKGKGSYQPPLDYKKIIAIMAPEATGKTITAVNLAWYFSQKKIKTILIDADLEKKDVYYYFNKDFANCLASASKDGKATTPIEINRYLSIYSEHRDVKLSLTREQLSNLILRSKEEAQVVLVDIGTKLEENVLRDLLALVDHRLLVVDQRMNTLNRMPNKLYLDGLKELKVDLLINRYSDDVYVKRKNIKHLFKDVEVNHGGYFNIDINQIFTVTDDYLSILKALEERRPPITVAGNKFKADIVNLARHYYHGV